MSLNASQLDAVGELVNIGIGRAAGMLNQLLSAPVELQVPKVKVGALDELTAELDRLSSGQLSSVRIRFGGELGGQAALVIPPESASQLVDLLTGNVPAGDFDSLKRATLTEVGNILINGVMGSIGNVLKTDLHYEVPEYLEGAPTNLFLDGSLPKDGHLLIVETRFSVRDKNVRGALLLVFDVASFETLNRMLDELTPS